MSIDELRSFPGCEHLSDEEARDRINTLSQLARIFYLAFIKENGQPQEPKQVA